LQQVAPVRVLQQQVVRQSGPAATADPSAATAPEAHGALTGCAGAVPVAAAEETAFRSASATSNGTAWTVPAAQAAYTAIMTARRVSVLENPVATLFPLPISAYPNSVVAIRIR
jgi:hypothetical protein